MPTFPPLLAGHPRSRTDLPNRIRESHNNGRLRYNHKPFPNCLPCANHFISPDAPRPQSHTSGFILQLPPSHRYNKLPRPISDIPQRLPTIPIPPSIPRDPRRNRRLQRSSHQIIRPRSGRQEAKIQTRTGLLLHLGIRPHLPAQRHRHATRMGLGL